MDNKTAVLWLTPVVSLLLIGGHITADQRPGQHTHNEKTPPEKPAEGHEHTTEGHSHHHRWWETLPAEYANARSSRWDVLAYVHARFHKSFLTASTRLRALSRCNTAGVLSLFILTGCRPAYTLPPLTTQHPAHPEALAAPAWPPSPTLAYGPSDLPSPQPASAMAQREMPHGKHGAQPSLPASQHTVVGEGKVVAVVRGNSQIVVDHKEIKGFMGAMTMGYQVKPPSLLDQLKAGDMVRFTIDTRQNAIITLETVQER